MPRPPPKPLAFALVIAHFISQLRIAERSQRIRRNKLSLPRRESLRIPCPSVVPLVRDATRLVNSRCKHPLHISFGRGQCLPQIDISPFLRCQRNQLPVLAHINSSNPSRLPIPRLQQPRRSRILRHAHGLLHRIRALIFFWCCLRRIWDFLRRSLPSGCRWTIRLSLILRPSPTPADHHEPAHHNQSARCHGPRLASHSATP